MLLGLLYEPYSLISHLGLLSLIHQVLLLLKLAISYAQMGGRTDESAREYNIQNLEEDFFLFVIRYRV